MKIKRALSDYFQVIFHGVVTLVVLVVAAILTAGYVDTCQNLHEEVRCVLLIESTKLMYNSSITSMLVFAGEGC